MVDRTCEHLDATARRLREVLSEAEQLLGALRAQEHPLCASGLADDLPPLLRKAIGSLGSSGLPEGPSADGAAPGGPAAASAPAEVLADLVAVARDALYRRELRPDDRYTYISPAITDLYGYCADELNGMGVEGMLARVHPDDREVYRAGDRALQEGGAADPIDTVEYRWLCASGAYRWFTNTRRLVRDADGRPLAMVGSIRDSDRRKRAELALQRANQALQDHREELEVANGELRVQADELASSNRTLQQQREELEVANEELQQQTEELEVANEELLVQQDTLVLGQRAREAERLRYQDLFGSAPVAYLITDLHGATVEANRAAAGLLGYGADAPASARLSAHLLPAELSVYRHLIARLGTTGHTQRSEMRLRPLGADAEVRVVDCTITRLTTPAGDDRLRWVLLDVTERTRVEKALRRERELLQTIYDTIPVMLAVYDPELENIVLSRHVERVTGWTDEDTALTSIMELAYPDPAYRADVAAYMQSLAPGFRDLDVATKDGGVVHSSWANIQLPDGRQVGIGIDITERRRMEAQLRESERILKEQLETAERLQQISTQMIQADDVDALYTQILHTAAETVRSDCSSLQMLEVGVDGAEGLRLLGSWGLSPDAVRQWAWVTAQSESACGEVLRTGERVVVPDVRACALLTDGEHQHVFAANGIQAVQSTPLISRSGALLGIISTHWREPRTPTAQELGALDILARQAADLIDRVRVEEARASVARFPGENPFPVLRVGADGALSYANRSSDALLATWGARLGEPLPGPWAERILAALASGSIGRVEALAGETLYELLIVPLAAQGYVNVYASDVTERVRAEEALRDRETRLRLATESARVGVFEWDVPNDTAVWENERMYEIFGRSHVDGPIGRAEFLEQALHPDHMAPFERALAEAVATGELFRPVLRIRRKSDGQWRWIEYTARIDLDGQGAPVRMIGVLADITERVCAEEALRESEARLREVLDQSRDAIYRRNLRTNSYGYFSPAIEALTGYTADELVGMGPEDLLALIHRGDLPVYQAANQALEQSTDPSPTDTVEYRWRCKWGEYRWFATSRRLLRDAQGRPLAHVGAIRDITHQKEAEQALRASETRYRTLFESIDEGFCVIEVIYDEEGRPVDYLLLVGNPALARHTGLVDPVGRRVREMIPDHDQHWFDTYGQVARTGEAVRFQNYAAPLRRWFDVYAFRHGLPADQQVAVLIRDITTRRAAEEVLQRRMDDLGALYEASQALLSDLEPEQILQRACDLAVQRFGLRMAYVALVSEGQLRAAAVAGHDEGYTMLKAEPLDDPERTTWPLRRALHSGEVVVVPDIATEPSVGEERRQQALARGYRGMAAIPFTLSDGEVGALGCYAAETGAFDEERVQSLRSLANLACAGMEKARLYQAVRRHAATLEDLVAVRTAELRESESRYRVALRSGAIMVAHVDRDLRYTWIHNPHSDFGRPEVIGKRDDELVSPEEDPGIAELVALKQRVLDSGQGDRQEIAFRRSNGTIVYEIVAEPLRDEWDRIQGVTTAALDVTERRQAQHALAESEARFRAVYEGSVMGIALVDLEGRVMTVNQALEAITGWERESLQGRELPSLFPASGGSPSLAEMLARLAQQVDPFRCYEQHYVRHDGAVRWLDGTVSLVRDDADVPQFALVMVQDITEEHEARAALVQAEKLNATGQLAAAFAHEIKNPLQGVIGCLGLLEEAMEGDAVGRRYLEVAKKELYRTNNIVTRMRDLHSRADPGEHMPTDLREVLGHVLTVVAPQCLRQHVEVQLEIPDDLPLVPAIPDQIQQLFLNLCLNAIDAMPEGGTLRVRPEPTAEPSGVRVVVIDSGLGIPEESLSHIFEFLYSTKEQGTGMGLFVCRDIVRGHRGLLNVESQVGVGSTFTVWLPCA